MRFLYTLFFLMPLFSVTAVAQFYLDVAKVQYQNFPSNNFGISNSTTSLDGLTAGLFLPIEMKNKDMLVFGTNYKYYQLTDHSGDLRNESLAAVSLSLGGIKKWKDGKWSVMMLALPKISSDMKNVTSDHFQMGGVALFTRIRNEKFKYKFGLFYNREFFGNFFLPLAGFEYAASDRFKLSILAPRSLHAEYKISSKFYTGFAHNSIVSSFMLSNGDNYLREGHHFWGYRQNKIFIDFYPMKSLVVFTELGITTGRVFEIHDKSTREEVEGIELTGVNPIYADVANNVFFNVGVAFRKRLD